MECYSATHFLGCLKLCTDVLICSSTENTPSQVQAPPKRRTRHQAFANGVVSSSR